MAPKYSHLCADTPHRLGPLDTITCLLILPPPPTPGELLQVVFAFPLILEEPYAHHRTPGKHRKNIIGEIILVIP